MDDKALFREAEKVLPYSYSPYSHFRVGAALLLADGRVVTGVNIENASYPVGLCAERTAMAKAISQGDRDFVAIAIASDSEEAWPCGMCRQFLYEFCPQIRVICGKDEDHLRTYTLQELLPEGFAL